MKIKVCGMRNPQNITRLLELKPDFIGFIFYKKSARYVDHLSSEVVNLIPSSIQKVGVFVNEEVEEMLRISQKYQLNSIQLHGKESIEICQQVKAAGLICIKAFSIEKPEDFAATKAYESYADYFLFDTKTPSHGGSGIKFDWSMLQNYKGETPFFLSGGISFEDTEKIKKLIHPLLFCLDINSRFEIEPGMKDIQVVKHFFDEMKK